MKYVRKYQVRDKSFTIVIHEDMYCAIDDEYIDENGRLTASLNGLQMNACTDLRQCMRMTKDSVDYDYYKSQGMTEAEAMSKVTGMKLETCKLLFE